MNEPIAFRAAASALRATPLRVIVNADDLGASPAINSAIFGLMAEGRIRSASLVANGAAFEDAVSTARGFPHCSFGVHLNASQWAPLTGKSGFEPILYDNGDFADNRLREIAIGRELRAALYREWCAQVERVRSSGIPVSHLDGHHHMHTLAGVFFVLKAVQKKFGLRRVRRTRNMYESGAEPPMLLPVKKQLWQLTLTGFDGTETTDGFSSLRNFYNDAARLPRHWRSFEAMVHPGPFSDPFERELLARDWWRDLPFGVEFINYHEL